ncbi:metallophosphoesterase [Bacteroidota bacterium]
MLTKIGFGILILLFAGLTYSFTAGKDDLVVRNVEIKSELLPASFDGMRIVHISDIHIKNYDDPDLIDKLIKTINDERPDLLVYTGDYGSPADMLNGPGILSRINAPFGKYAVIGNHDYGESEKASDNWKDENYKLSIKNKLKSIYKKWDVKLLLNESEVVEIENDSIALIGVEVYDPHHGFNDSRIDAAVEDVNEIPFKILLNHNPDLWDNEILGKRDIQLTLSGHTHGGQIGVMLGAIKFSFAQLMFDRWGGLYQENDQYLYVNSGLGWYGVSLRMGIPAEVTVIKLSADDKELVSN